MTWPERIRGAIRTLLGSELVVELRREIEELKLQRDYFKARSDRLELVLMAPKLREQPPGAPPLGTQMVSGRKTWKQIQEEHQEQHKRELEAAAKKAKEQN